MNEPPAFYDRMGLHVATYDAQAALAPIAGDVEFYVALARETGGPVLDLGGGTGRVAWPLAEAGFDVTTLDLSEPMLDQSRRKAAEHDPEVAGRVSFVHGDLRTFDLPQRFALAIAPFRVFQLLLSAADQHAALAAIHRHLRPGGVFVAHLFDPLLDYCLPMDGPSRDPDRGTVAVPQSDHTVTITSLHRVTDPLEQVFTERWEFVERDGVGNAVRREEELLSMRWTYRREMRYLLELAGFEVEREDSDFRGSPPRYGAEQVWTARKPA